MQPGHWPATQIQQQGHWPATQIPRTGHWPSGPNRHPDGDHRGGVGYRAQYPYFYAGYPGLLSFGYGLPLGYGNDLVEGNEPQAPAPPPDFSNEPPLENPPEIAASDAPMFRPQYQPQVATAPVHAQPATTLVFSDGRPSMEVHNYALTGSTLYALDGDTRWEIPLSELNVPATIAANRKTGVDFALPTSH